MPSTRAMPRTVEVATGAALELAVRDPAVAEIVVTTDLHDVPSLQLAPGQIMRGASPGVTIRFGTGQDGLVLTSDNGLEALHIETDLGRLAVSNATSVADWGRFMLRGLTIRGCVRLLAQDQVRSGHVHMDGVDIVAADARGFDQRPSGYGVEVVAGALTLWNRQLDPGVAITADLVGITLGRAGAPVRGSGVFVGGAGDTGGRMLVRRLETGAVFSDGGIAPGTADRISGGVFTVHGAYVDVVHNHGPVTTYGPNDMVLDNWGTVDRWIAEQKITSFGSSAIGFVNFGTIGTLHVNAVIETFGAGARGFNVYSGTVNEAAFERVVTRADGAVGVQISRPVGRITVRRGIETFGGVGDSLVKGVVLKLPATPLSIKPGGSARQITIAGGLVSHGEGIEPLQVHGAIEVLEIAGGFTGWGGGFATI
jgi:hypothetical protein